PATLRAGGSAALLAVLEAQKLYNETPFNVSVNAAGETIDGGTRGGVTLQTELFAQLPDGTLGGERDAYVQTRVLTRFDAACRRRLQALGVAAEQEADECAKGPAKAYGIIAGQRISTVFQTLPATAGPLKISLA